MPVPPAALALLVCAALMHGQSRQIPAQTIPLPNTVSPELQKVIAPAAPEVKSGWKLTADQWKQRQKQTDEARGKAAHATRELFHVAVTEEKIAGVHVYRLKPPVIAPENKNRILVHVHGGAYVFGGGEAATAEALMAANFGKIEVVSVDYRMPPDFPYPAALDDAMAVWKDVAKTHSPKNMGLFGTSTGGGMTLAMVLIMKDTKMPLPGAIMAGTPWSDLTKTGDTYFTHENIDNVLGAYDGRLEEAAKIYAGKHDLKEPLLSPIYGDFTGFPPTILLSGTRDLFLSNTVRTHQKLLKSGVTAELLVFEGQSHGQYNTPNAPESADAWTQVSKFFNKHLGK